MGELPGTGRPGGHLQTLLGSKETAFWLVSGQSSDQEVWAPSSPLYFCPVPVQHSRGSSFYLEPGSAPSAESSPELSLDAQGAHHRPFLLLEFGSPRLTLSGAGAATSGWTACLCKAGLPALGGRLGPGVWRDWCPGPKLETGTGAPTPQLPLPLLWGSSYIPPSPGPPKFVWGRGTQEAGSPPLSFIQSSPSSLCLEIRWEKSSAFFLHSLNPPAVNFEKKPLRL